MKKTSFLRTIVAALLVILGAVTSLADTAFADFSVIVNNQTGTLLTTDEITNKSAVNFGIAVTGNVVSRVEAGNASSAATISGTYHSEHGLTGMSVVVPVPGNVTIQIGKCTYSSNKITITDSNNEKVIEYTPVGEQGSGDLVCWKNNPNNVIELEYTGEATTLTITGMSYCPFIAVKKTKTAVEKSLYSTDFSEWSTFSASTTMTNINKTTNYSNEALIFSVYNTALMSVSDTKFQNYASLPHNALQAAKAADPYVITSKLASITKVRYIHGATGSNRGWKLEAKGDGDTDWVTISDSYANPSAWCEVTKDIKKTNCQLRFTNLNSGQNAYMFELEIFGEVEQTLYEITGTVTGGNIDGSSIIFTENGDTYSATVIDGAFTMSVPAGTYTPSLSGNVAYILKSPTSIEVSASGSIGAITIEAASAQTVTGQIVNAPAEAFTLTFTGNSHNNQVECAAGATSFTVSLDPDTYVISSSVGTLSPLSQESFKVLTEAVNFNIYYPEAAVPAATQQEITVDNKATVAANVYRTITDALAAAQAGNISAPVITLTSGQTYREQVIVDMPNVTLKTSGAEKAKITWYYGIGYAYYSLGTDGYYSRDRAMTRNSIKMVDPARWGAAVLVKSKGNGFKAENIIFENSFNQYYTTEEVVDGVTPNGVQSITYNRKLTSGESGYKAADAKAITERAAAIGFENNPSGCQLYNCVFIGSQDTFYSSGKLYVKNCNIIGNTDYIFGGGYVVFDDCDLTIGGYSDQSATAYITASNGGTYVFRDCTVKAGNRQYVAANLGRDWGGTNANVYYLNLKNEIGNKLTYKWTNMGGAVTAGTANLHIYDFDPTVNANYNTTGTSGANVNGTLTADQAKERYTEAVTQLGFTPEQIYDITLDENIVYNDIRIAAANGGTGDVTITRNIAAGQWNTLCLPFSMTAAQVTETFGTGTKLAKFTSYDATAKELTMTSATDITAGQPCMIWVETAVGEAKTISGVTYSSADPVVTQNGVTFQGTYQSGNIPSGAYFVSANNLYQSNGSSTIKPFRGYFTAPEGARLLFADDATGIASIIQSTARHEVYDLQGRKVNGMPQKGLYIIDGKKHTIK